jgi:hypothetical protein
MEIIFLQDGQEVINDCYVILFTIWLDAYFLGRKFLDALYSIKEGRELSVNSEETKLVNNQRISSVDESIHDL